MSNGHPTFPNPTIQEALCEIHFRLPDASSWKPSIFGDLFKHIQKDFPELEPIMEMGLQVQIGPSSVGQALLPPQQRMRYKHASRNLVLQLSPNTFTVNVLPKYEGWAQLKKDVLQSWGKAREVLNPAGIERIGLRYINRIDRTRSEDSPGNWLAPSDYIPKSVLSSLPGFLSRLEVRTDQYKRLIVTLGETVASSGQAFDAIIFDIDCISERKTGVEDAAIIDEISLLHDIAWNVFSSSLTPRLKSLLNGDEK